MAIVFTSSDSTIALKTIPSDPLLFVPPVRPADSQYFLRGAQTTIECNSLCLNIVHIIHIPLSGTPRYWGFLIKNALRYRVCIVIVHLVVCSLL
jgi:hypothetical protein